MTKYYIAPRNRRAHHVAQLAQARQTEVHIPVDVIVDGDDFILSAYVPGVLVEDVKIEVIENVIAISGEFPMDEILSEDAQYLLRERPYGRFKRVLRLPAKLDTGKAEAEVINGLLTLRVSKAEEAKAKLIKVKAK